MDKITAQRTSIIQAIEALFFALDEYDSARKDPSCSEQRVILMRSGLIQHFECASDLLWKVVATYLKTVHGVNLTATSPKIVARAACNAQILTEKEADNALTIIDDRNLTSHTYDSAAAEEIAQRIPKYAKLMHTILDRVKQ